MPAIGVTSVLGSPITRPTIQPRDSARKTILPRVRAQIPNPSLGEPSLGLRFAGDSYNKALEAVKDLKKEYGGGSSTLGFIYNGTGSDITREVDHNWEGQYFIIRPPPSRIENMQWGWFLHVHDGQAVKGSVGAVVYRGLNRNRDSFDALLAWNNRGGVRKPNTAYPEIREPDHYTNPEIWPVLRGRLETSSFVRTDIGFEGSALVEIDPQDHECAHFMAILTLAPRC